jgi:hypothetical protein
MIDNLFSDNILRLFAAGELVVDEIHLSTEEILTCAGLVIAASPKWSAQRNIITSLMLNLDEESMQHILMFIDLKAIESAIPNC